MRQLLAHVRPWQQLCYVHPRSAWHVHQKTVPLHLKYRFHTVNAHAKVARQNSVPAHALYTAYSYSHGLVARARRVAVQPDRQALQCVLFQNQELSAMTVA
jgi:hypothetical protein